MFNNLKNKAESEKSNQVKKENPKPTYWERVIQGKGTVAEDWPTAEELWNNVKEEVEEVQATLNPIKKEKNS